MLTGGRINTPWTNLHDISEPIKAYERAYETNWPFAASGHMVHAGGQAAHWDTQNKKNSNLS